MARTILPVRPRQVWADPKNGRRYQVQGFAAGGTVNVLDLDHASYGGPGPELSFLASRFAGGDLEFDRSGEWTREELEALKGWERPLIRCRYGSGEGDQRDFLGQVFPDGNKAWVVIEPNGHGGGQMCEDFSWPLVLEVMNDGRQQPLWFWKR